MSKYVKDYMVRDYKSRIEGVEDALVVSIRGIDAITNNKMRLGLAEKQIRITVVRNNLVKGVIADTGLEGLGPILEGPSALAYGAESVIEVAREVVKWAKEIEHLELKGAILDGELFTGKAGVEKLSKFPTREEAQGELITLILSPAQTLVGQIGGPGGQLMGVLKTIEERLEKGEEITKIA